MSLPETLLRRFASEHPNSAAALLGDRPPEETASTLGLLPQDLAATVLSRMPTLVASAALLHLGPDRGSPLLARLDLDRAATLLRHAQEASREEFITRHPRASRLRALIAYPPDTVGALMDPSVLALGQEVDLAAARRQVGEFAAHVALELYLVDDEHRFVGVADLREVLDPARTGPLEALARSLEPLRDRADAATASLHRGWLRHDTLPVVDDRGTYLGAVRGERLRQVAHDAARRRSRGGAEAVFALGEIFWLGLGGVFSSLARQKPGEAR